MVHVGATATVMASVFEISKAQCVQFFEVGRKISDVFFDAYHRRVITTERQKDVLNVVVHGNPQPSAQTIRLQLLYPEAEQMLSMKLSFDKNIMAVQKSDRLTEFYNISVDQTVDPLSYSQACKSRSTKLNGIEWTNTNEILFITAHGLELYQVNPDKHSVRLLKSHNISSNWFIYSQTQLLVMSSTTLGNIMNPFLFKGGTIVRLTKFEVELAANPQPPRLVLLDRDVTIGSVYGSTYLFVLRHNPRPVNCGAEVLVYQINRSGLHLGDSNSLPAKRIGSLRLGATDRFAIHVIDSLIIVHQQAAKTSLIYDLGCVVASLSSGPIDPILSPMPLKLLDDAALVPSPAKTTFDMYAATWVIFQPNIVVDAPSGIMWFIRLNFTAILDLISSKVLLRYQQITAIKVDLVDFLLRRATERPLIFEICREAIASKTIPFADLARIFDRINGIYRSHLSLQSNAATDVSSVTAASSATPQFYSDGSALPANAVYQICIHQAELYRHIFFPLHDSEEMDQEYLANVLLELLQSLHKSNVPVQPYFHELLVNCLVQCKQFSKLHQLTQFSVIEDSKPLAFLFLALEAQYPPSLQIAIDMLLRLQNANEEVVEILLSKQKVLQALRFAQGTGLLNAIAPMKFVEAAWSLEDRMIFFLTFRFFQQRNFKLKGTAQFGRGSDFERYYQAFLKMQGKSGAPDDSTISESTLKSNASSKELMKLSSSTANMAILK